MLSLAEAWTITVSDLSKLLGGPGPERAKLMNFSTVLGAAGVAGEAFCPPTAFAAKMFSLNFQSMVTSLSRNGHSVMLCWQV